MFKTSRSTALRYDALFSLPHDPYERLFHIQYWLMWMYCSYLWLRLDGQGANYQTIEHSSSAPSVVLARDLSTPPPPPMTSSYSSIHPQQATDASPYYHQQYAPHHHVTSNPVITTPSTIGIWTYPNELEVIIPPQHTGGSSNGVNSSGPSSAASNSSINNGHHGNQQHQGSVAGGNVKPCYSTSNITNISRIRTDITTITRTYIIINTWWWKVARSCTRRRTRAHRRLVLLLGASPPLMRTLIITSSINISIIGSRPRRKRWQCSSRCRISATTAAAEVLTRHSSAIRECPRWRPLAPATATSEVSDRYIFSFFLYLLQ